MYRLPAWARPTAYNITAAFSVSQRTFGGRVRIKLAVSRPTRRLYLNAKGLKLSNVYLEEARGEMKSAVGAVLGDDNQELGVCR